MVRYVSGAIGRSVLAEVQDMSDLLDVVEAFADGEPVEPSALLDALSKPEGREHLVDVLVLRGLVGDHGSARPAALAPARPARSRVRRLAVAASLAAVSMLGGYVWGQRTSELPIRATDTPAVAPSSAPVPAPAPTRIIRLETGVDWNERGGGR